MSCNDLDKKVGGFTQPVAIRLHRGESVAKAIAQIRNSSIEDQICYFYVVDAMERLCGVVSTRDLLRSSEETSIDAILQEDIISVADSNSLKEAMHLFMQYRLLALPVVNATGQLVGIIDVQFYFDEAIDFVKAQVHAADLFHVMGLSLKTTTQQNSLKKTYVARMPWIFCNMAGGITCAVISCLFETVLMEVIVLAMFIPLVLTLSESISMQSMSCSLQLINQPGFSKKRRIHYLLREWTMVAFLALTCGTVVGLLSLLWDGGLGAAAVITSGIMLSVGVTGILGAMIPLVLHARKLDPKVAAGPIVLMFADVITTLIYLGTAALWLI